jgi:hypothetical protein
LHDNISKERLSKITQKTSKTAFHTTGKPKKKAGSIPAIHTYIESVEFYEKVESVSRCSNSTINQTVKKNRNKRANRVRRRLKHVLPRRSEAAALPRPKGLTAVVVKNNTKLIFNE